MPLPFSNAAFFEVFARYNRAVWPAQWLLSGLGAVVLIGVACGSRKASRLAYAILGALWVWMALAYHLAFFAEINPAAPLFAAHFLAAGVLLFARGAFGAAPVLAVRRDLRSALGLAAALFGLVVYSLLHPLFGHAYPAAAGFGLPCPTTIFTLGVLAFAHPRPDRWLVVVPLLWSFVGGSAAIVLDVPQDWVLLLAGFAGVGLLLSRHSAPEVEPATR